MREEKKESKNPSGRPGRTHLIVRECDERHYLHPVQQFQGQVHRDFLIRGFKDRDGSISPGSPVDLPVFNLSLCIGLNIPHVLGNHICREVLLELRQCDNMNHSPHPLLRALQHMKGEI